MVVINTDRQTFLLSIIIILTLLSIIIISTLLWSDFSRFEYLRKIAHVVDFSFSTIWNFDFTIKIWK